MYLSTDRTKFNYTKVPSKPLFILKVGPGRMTSYIEVILQLGDKYGEGKSIRVTSYSVWLLSLIKL